MSFRAGYIGLIGLPNAGKSTLLNALVGEKVAIVTPKPQTTRSRVVGILTSERAQVCFNDAPGLIRAERGLNKFLAQEFNEVIADSDALVAVLNLDASSRESLAEVIATVAAAKKPWLALITKNDLNKPQRVVLLKELLQPHVVPVVVGSAENDPVALKAELVPLLEEMLPQSPGPLFDVDLYTVHSTRDLAAELIREQCFLHLHEEVPFGLAVRMRSFDESGSPTVRIEADLVVSKEGHRGMVIGAGGSRLKTIGRGARQQIEKLLGSKVYLGLHVAVRPKWADNPRMMKELGYELEHA